MSREVRMVPADWEHPKNYLGEYQPLYDRVYEIEAREWMNESALWSIGKHPDQNDEYAKTHDMPEFYWDWSGGHPEQKCYRPSWPEESRTHIQMYEATSGGTPISPVMKNPEELARWLADNNASAFGYLTATYEEWLARIKIGWAPAAVMKIGSDGSVVMRSGVANMVKIDKE